MKVKEEIVETVTSENKNVHEEELETKIIVKNKPIATGNAVFMQLGIPSIRYFFASVSAIINNATAAQKAQPNASLYE